MEPEFRDPPPPGGGGREDDIWAKTVAALIASTGEWALIFVGDYKAAGRLTGRVRQSRAGWAGHWWEVTTRNNGTPLAIHVYVRHIKSLKGEGDDQR